MSYIKKKLFNLIKEKNLLFNFELTKPSLPTTFIYGYKERLDGEYVNIDPFLDIYLSDKLFLDKEYLIIPLYEINGNLIVNKFNNFIEEDIYKNNDFINYIEGVFDTGFNKYGLNHIELVNEKTNGNLLLSNNIKQYNDDIKEINYFTFIELVKLIDEYKNENYCDELRFISGLGGKFYQYENKGIFVVERISKEYLYVSYIATFKEYRHQNLLERIIGNIQRMYPHQKILLVATVDKILIKYLKMGFSQIGYLKNYVD